MAARRRRNHSRRMRGTPQGKSFWIRPPSFAISEQATSTGVFSDLILAPSDFEDPHAALNDTKRGAPVVERLIVDVGFSQVVNGTYFAAGGGAQVTMHVEAMVFMQSDQFATVITGSLAFDDVLENQRILGYAVMDYTGSNDTVNAQNQIALHHVFEPKSRIRLREQAIGVAIRANFNLGISQSLANFNYVQATMLIRQP